jgi:hypothetical protein
MAGESGQAGGTGQQGAGEAPRHRREAVLALAGAGVAVWRLGLVGRASLSAGHLGNEVNEETSQADLGAAGGSE